MARIASEFQLLENLGQIAGVAESRYECQLCIVSKS